MASPIPTRSPASEPGRYAAEETRAALRWTRNAADAEHDLAETVVHGMPEVFDAWWAGRIDRQRVRVLDRYPTGVSAEVIERICSVAVPLAPTRTTGQLGALLRRMVIAADPDAAARWYRKGLSERGVTAYPAADGTVTISANGLPVDEAEAACLRIEKLADAAKRAGHPARIGQIRCDLFLGLLDGRFHHRDHSQIIAALLGYHASATGTQRQDQTDGRRGAPARDSASDHGTAGSNGARATAGGEARGRTAPRDRPGPATSAVASRSASSCARSSATTTVPP